MNATRCAQLTTTFLKKDGGGPVTFSRITNVSTVPPTRITALCPYAFWRNYRPNELGNGVVQGDSLMVIQGSALPGLIAGLTTPPRKNDKVNMAGYERNVESVDVLFNNGIPVRINLTLRG